jgi:hypothetical protein
MSAMPTLSRIITLILSRVEGVSVQKLHIPSLLLTGELEDMISIQLTVDGGTEVNEMLKIHERLRYTLFTVCERY